jgi:phenylpropionate dioxygenase-like ring-hydroxylating dioxygenase large terminal subunit
MSELEPSQVQGSVRSHVALSEGRRDWGTWPRYEAAVLGFRNYWYPVLWSREVTNRPVPVTLLGENIMLIRDRGKVHALHDRCLHRGVPLSLGAGWLGQRAWSRQEFPGTISCGYHGWTYDLSSGVLCAALTDGPDSPICGKVRVRTYPVEERLGLIWIYVGDIDPPALENDIPRELLEKEHAMGGRITIRDGNWRYAAENGFDEAHPRYLHRNALWTIFRRLPAWTKTRIDPIEEGDWITYVPTEVHTDGDYPGLGHWPPKYWWSANRKGGPKIAVRMPCNLRVAYPEWTHYAWYVPVDADHHRYVQIAVKFTSGLDAALFRLRYALYIRWIFHTAFNNQDALAIAAVDAPPERFYRPDAAIIGWRKMCESPRGLEPRTDVSIPEPEELLEEAAPSIR